jgi:phage terminase small subunit
MGRTALTEKQARFCDQYVICGNAAAAARMAGYPERSARQIGAENLTKPDIQAAIRARQRAHAAQLELTRQDVIAAVLEAIRLAREQGVPAVMLRGWIEIAKITGLDKPEPREERQHRPLSPGGQRVKARYEAMSDSELLQLIAAGE